MSRTTAQERRAAASAVRLQQTTRIQLWPRVQTLVDGPHTIFFSPWNHRWVKVNEDGRRVLESFRNEQSLGDWLTQHVADSGAHDATAGLRRFIAGQIDNGILQADGAARAPDWSGVDPLALQKVYLEITDHCNQACRYCYNAWSREQLQARATRRMSRDDYYRLLDELQAMGLQEVVFSGGEPLCCPWTLDLAKRSRQCGIKTTLLTNGTLITTELAAGIVEAFNNVDISLDSPEEEKHDYGRGAGSYRQVRAGIRNLQQAGHQAIILKPVLSRHNLDGFETFPRFAREELHCYLYTPTLCLPFRAADGVMDMSLTPDLQATLKVLEKFAVELERYYPVSERPPVQIGPHLSCGLGKRILSVDVLGDVYPCQALHDPALACGNLFEQGIGDIHQQSPVVRRLEKLTVFDVETCGQCDWALLCSGGCRAFAFGLYGDLKTCNKDFCDFLLESAKRRLIEFVRLSSTATA